MADIFYCSQLKGNGKSKEIKEKKGQKKGRNGVRDDESK
jgi:hypothetical protein